jgi:hypothetical protein
MLVNIYTTIITIKLRKMLLRLYNYSNYEMLLYHLPIIYIYNIYSGEFF